MALDSQPGRGSTFHVYLPLPPLTEDKREPVSEAEAVMLLVTSSRQPPEEILKIARRQGLEIYLLSNLADLEKAVQKTNPAVLAWDLAEARPGDWALIRRLRHYPALSRLPFMLFGKTAEEKEKPSTAMTGFVLKTGGNQSLLTALEAISPFHSGSVVLIVDDDPQARADHKALVEIALPGYPIRLAEDGARALELMQSELPALVLLDLMMPGASGTDVLDQMRCDPRLRQVPVIILSNKVMSLEDVKRLEKHYHVVFQSKGIWMESEAASALHRALFGIDLLPPHTSALVKRAVAFLQENYRRTLSRWEIAEAVGVSGDYLTRVFSRELGLTPWDYLNRYRTLQAKSLLRNTDENIACIARQVGFHDPAYFSRVFRKAVGQSPEAFREQAESE